MADKPKSQMLTAVIFTVAAASAAGCVGGSPEVMESSSTFSCCGSPAVPFDQRCENTWSISGTNFASNKLLGGDHACTAPCKEVKDGEMLLQKCVDVNLTAVCTETSVIEEARIHFHGQPCSKSHAAGLQAGFAGFFLLTLLITGWFVQ